MYIAFKWLIFLTLGMWLTLCMIDMMMKKRTKELHVIMDIAPKPKPATTLNDVSKNVTKVIQMRRQRPRKYMKHYQSDLTLLHYLTFFAGALVVTVYNRKDEIFSYTKRKLIIVNSKFITKCVRIYIFILSETASKVLTVILKYKNMFYLMVLTIVHRIQFKFKQGKIRDKLNVLLLKELKKEIEERNNLGQLLSAALLANRRIRLQYQLEVMAKNRLQRHIEDTSKQIKENKSRYVSFQQQYLMTHQENIFLKERVRKLTLEKEDAEKKLLRLVTEIYQSKNDSLKAFCNKFMVQTRDSLMKSDISLEVQKFLQQSRVPMGSSSNWQITRETNNTLNVTQSWPNTRVAEVMSVEDSLLLSGSMEPKLRGLPGEYVWTVKDKNGIIEKLYECDYGYDFYDNIETVRRIRQYSVYHDKDCLLDFSNSRTVVETTRMSDLQGSSYQFCRPQELNRRQRFLTNSEPFQKFLRDNRSVVGPMSTAPPLLCG